MIVKPLIDKVCLNNDKRQTLETRDTSLIITVKIRCTTSVDPHGIKPVRYMDLTVSAFLTFAGETPPPPQHGEWHLPPLGQWSVT